MHYHLKVWGKYFFFLKKCVLLFSKDALKCCSFEFSIKNIKTKILSIRNGHDNNKNYHYSN